MWSKLKTLPFKRKLSIHYALCIAGSLLMMISGEFQNFCPLLITGCLVLALGLIFRILLIRCPHCRDGLYQKYTDLIICPKCGKPLE